jgi:starvation-inducible DNA-binding protein
MHDTRDDIAAKARSRTAEVLNARLADALDGAVDEIAERITALGGTAQGTVAAIARNTSLAPYPEDIYDGAAHVEALANAVAAFGKKLCKSAHAAEKVGDSGTEDLLVGISQEADKYLWFLEAHLQAKR